MDVDEVSDVPAVQVGQTYMQLHHQMHRRLDQAMTCAGLSIGRAKVLFQLEERGSMNQARLAGLIGFAPRSVTDTVDALEREGLVTRTEDERDRRARIVALTDAGRDAVDTAQVIRRKAMDETFGSLAPTERAALSDLLAKIQTKLAGDVNCDR